MAEQLGDVANKGLDESEISALPISRYIRRDSVSEQDTQDIMECSECRICLSRFEENERLRTLPCLHRFHLGCIDPWIKVCVELLIFKNSIDFSYVRVVHY